MKRAMTLLLIEDDIEECETFKQKIRNRDDVRLIGVTNSSTEGLNILKTSMPEGVILDMELNKGEGSGIKFLKEFNKISTDIKPLIFVTTNTKTRKMYDFLHENDVDFIFSKSKEDYSVEEIIDTFLLMRSTLYKKDNRKEYINPEEDYKTRAMDKIDSELDLIGITRQLKGWKYIKNAIYYLLTIDFDKAEGTVFNYIARENGIASSSVIRAMQTAIYKAWSNSPIDELTKYYTQKVHYSTGVPSPTELIYFYKEKVGKFLDN